MTTWVFLLAKFIAQRKAQAEERQADPRQPLVAGNAEAGGHEVRCFLVGACCNDVNVGTVEGEWRRSETARVSSLKRESARETDREKERERER